MLGSILDPQLALSGLRRGQLSLKALDLSLLGGEAGLVLRPQLVAHVQGGLYDVVMVALREQLTLRGNALQVSCDESVQVVGVPELNDQRSGISDPVVNPGWPAVIRTICDVLGDAALGEQHIDLAAVLGLQSVLQVGQRVAVKVGQ